VQHHKKQKKRILIFAVILGIFLLAGSNLTAVNTFDQTYFDKVYKNHTPFGDVFFPTVNEFGDGRFDYAVNLVYFTFGNEKDRDFAKINSLSLAATGLVIQGIKMAAHRRRPTYDSYDSFPSGHTGYVFAMATLFSDRYPKLRIPFYALAISTGIARMYLGKHYPSDVLVGAALGITIPAIMLHYKTNLLQLRW